jgi:hypothetical protein
MLACSSAVEWWKHFHRVAIRYDKRAAHDLGFVQIASIMVWLRSLGDTANNRGAHAVAGVGTGHAVGSVPDDQGTAAHHRRPGGAAGPETAGPGSIVQFDPSRHSTIVAAMICSASSSPGTRGLPSAR